MWLGRWYQPSGTGEIVATHGAAVQIENNNLQAVQATTLQAEINPDTKTAWIDTTRVSELQPMQLEVKRD